MNLRIKEWNAVKSKDAALNQAVAATGALERSQLKENKIMQTMEDLNRKIESLKEKIQDLQKSKEYLNENSEEIKKRLEFLKGEYNLTEAEILERKSALLRKQISQLQMLEQTTRPTGVNQKIES